MPRPTSRSAHPAISRFVVLIGTLSSLFLPRAGAAEPRPAEAETPLAERLPRIAPAEPAEALKTFRLAHGFRLELVAAEPDVVDPVDACFDADGRMYVAEMRDYPFHAEGHPREREDVHPEKTGRIRLLEDTDGDGTFDQSTVFADEISWPTSVCPYRGGVFVIAAPHIYYLKDTDGDDVADRREIVYSGIGRNNVQGLANNLTWGPDHHIYAAGGRNGAELTHRGEDLFSLGRRDIRFDPATEELEPATGGLQFGHSFDDWGNRFVCSNSNHILHVVFPQRYLERTPNLAVSNVVRGIAREGPAARVYRTSPPEPWRIVRQKWRAAEKGYRLIRDDEGGWRFVPLDSSGAEETDGPPTEYPVGYFTSATGVTIYCGDAFPEAFRGNAFIGDVGGNLVHRKFIEPNGVSFTAVRADEGREFLTSTDNWFRPVNFVNAPDGTLYILDMYRETIEHPWSVPPEIKRHLDLQSGNDRGRIYRLVPPGWRYEPLPRLAEVSTRRLVTELESENAWNRRTAARLIWERQDPEAVEPLETLLRSSSSPLARARALWALHGLDALEGDLVVESLQDPHPRVREQAARLAEPFLDSSPGLVQRLVGLCDDPDPRVRFQAAFSLGEVDGEGALPGLVRLARHLNGNADIRTALLTSVAGRADRLAVQLLDDRESTGRADVRKLVAELARLVGTNDDPQGGLRILAAAAEPGRPVAVQRSVIEALGDGLSRRGSSIPGLLAAEPVDSQVREKVRVLFEQAAKTATDASRPVSARIRAVALLAHADTESATDQLAGLLSPQVPQALQAAAVRALAERKDSDVARRLLTGWRSYSPEVRRRVLDGLLSREERIRELLAAVRAGTVRRADIARDQQQLLMNHPDGKIRKRARKLLGGEASGDRAEVVDEYRKALDRDGERQRGRKIFEEKCSICHRVGDVGHQVAPELASVTNKSPDDLLIAILDPNREAQPNYTSYTVVTTPGRVYNGIIAAETANNITLRRAEGKEDVILRDNIETMVSTGQSLMPEGFEKEISPREMADVIAFIQSIEPEGR